MIVETIFEVISLSVPEEMLKPLVEKNYYLI